MMNSINKGDGDAVKMSESAFKLAVLYEDLKL